MLHKGNAVSKEELQINVLRRYFYELDRNLDMHIRRKVSKFGFSKNINFTVINKGYCFEKN